MDNSKKIKRIIGIVSLLLIVAVLGYLTYFFIVEFSALKDIDSFKAYIRGFGIWGVFIALGIQILQVFVAFIPGEVVEVGLGFTYGAIGGTLLCYLGCFLASSVVFLAVKKYGIKFVELFISEEELNNMKFLRDCKENPAKLKRLTFILFFIPGTPKDLFTYLFGLTPIKFRDFIIISLLARFPSVISSTIGGTLLANSDYITAIILFVVTGLFSIAGWFCFDRYSKKANKK